MLAHAARLIEVADLKSCHYVLSLIDRVILSYRFGEVKQIAAEKAERMWRYNGGFRALLLSRKRAKFFVA